MNKLFEFVKPFMLPVGAYGLVIALVFGRALIPGGGEMILGDDIHRAYYFYRQFFNNFFSQGVWPWWNPYTFAGAPFMANPIVNIWYPPTWLFVLLPLNLAYSWHIALHLVWAMLGMYILLRRIISNISREAGSRFAGQYPISNEIKNSSILRPLSYVLRPAIGPWLAGLVFGLSGFFTARIWAGHVDVIAAASWMPWTIAAFVTAVNSKFQIPNSKFVENDQKFQEWRVIVIAGVVLAMQLFAGYQTMAMLTLEAVAVMTGIYCIAGRMSLWMIVQTIARVAVSVGLAVGLFAVVLIPQQELFRQSIRTYALPYSWNAYGSLTVQSLGQFINPFFFGDQLTYHGPPPNFAEHAFFVGRTSLLMVVVTLLVVIGSYVYRRLNRESRSMNREKNVSMVWPVSFLLITAFGLWVSLGPNAPIDLQYILWKLIPMYHYLRIPPRHLILVAFGLSGIVGISLNNLISKSQILNPKQAPIVNIQNSKQFGSLEFWILKLFRIWNLGFRIFISVAVFVIVAEMILYSRHFIALKPLPETRHDVELIKILKQDKVPYRVLTNFGAWASPRDSFDFDAGMQYGVFNATGYDTMILKTYYAFIDAANGAKIPSILEHDVQIPYLNVFSKATDTLNIKYILHPRAYDPLYGSQDPRFRLIREDVAHDYRLYENTTALPRFYFVDNKEGRVDIEKYSPNEIVLTTQSTVGATLMSSEVYYPGWEGFIDGKKVDIMKVNNTFRALFVPSGNHTVIYRYSPRIFLIGGGITLITMIAIAFWLRNR